MQKAHFRVPFVFLLRSVYAGISKAVGDDVLRRDAQAKINLYKHKYAAAAQASGLPTRADRMTVSGFKSVKVFTNDKQHVTMDAEQVIQDAIAGVRHGGIYRDAMAHRSTSLEKSIRNHAKQVEIHAEKIAHPAKYAEDWDNLSSSHRERLINKWNKDMVRNAEQEAIERHV